MGFASGNDRRTIQLLGIAGSLRRGSLNKALLRAAGEAAPAGIQITTFDIADIPLYDADVDAAGIPDAVARLRDRIRASDGLLIATPEYNYGVPGVLKNAIDWASRPPKETALRGKPAGIMGASTSMFGTARAQAQLRQAFNSTNTLAMLQPEIFVPLATDKFDGDGHLVDGKTRELLTKFMAALAGWIALVGAPAK